MSNSSIQTTGHYDQENDYFSISISPSNSNQLITYEGLTIEDMKDLESLIGILLEHYQEIKGEN